MRPWLALLLVPSVAHADYETEWDATQQCRHLTAEVAVRGREILAGNPRTVRFCEPCGDKAPGSPERLGAVVDREQTPGSGAFELVSGARRIDVAFLYVQVSDSIFSNVALMAGCRPLEVSPSLHVHATAAGAMLSPRAFPPAGPPTTIQLVASQVVIATAPWMTFAAGVGAGLASAVLVALGLRARRRRTLGTLGHDEPALHR
jgi:hypothetical protein